ncbi:MAG: hypothetical protein ACYS5V_17550, partial [Planctomycetota bacterium]
MVSRANELLAFTDRGAHRWMNDQGRWAFLDPQSPIRNPSLNAAAVVGDELWLGYTNKSFGVVGEQGISRFNERTGAWSYMPPEAIGTSCPVRAIAAGPDGDVWVLFRPRPWYGSAWESPLYKREPRGPTGLGRFRNGRWEFPVKLDGVPETVQRSRKGPRGVETRTEKLPIYSLAAAGGKLFVANSEGVYMGPGKWRRVVEAISTRHGSGRGPIPGIAASEDGKTLKVWRIDKDGKLQHASYNIASGTLHVGQTDRPTHYDDRLAPYSVGRLLAWPGSTEWIQRWV